MFKNLSHIISAVMAYLHIFKPSHQKRFLYVLLLFCLLNVKLFLATGFEIGTPLPKDRLDIPVAASSWVVTLETLLVINLT